MSNHNEGRSFWTTLPGILSGLAALLTAVGGLVTTIYLITSSGNSSSEPPTPTPVLRVTANAPGGVPVINPVPTSIVASPLSLEELQLTTGSAQGTIRPGQKVVYWFQVASGGRAEANIEASEGACIHLRLLDRSRELMEESGEQCGVFGYFSVLTDSSSGGVYYLEVESGSSIAAGSYTIDLQSQTQDDAGSGVDAGNTLDTALSLEGSLSRQGLVGSQDPDDYYRFRANANTVLEVQYADWEQLKVALLAVDSENVTVREEILPRGQLVDFGQRPEGEYALRISNQGTEALYTIILGAKSGQ